MAAGRPATIQEGRMLGGIVGVSQKSSGAADPLDESLLSMEKLDRSSPDLWPEQTGSECGVAASRRSGVAALRSLGSLGSSSVRLAVVRWAGLMADGAEAGAAHKPHEPHEPDASVPGLSDFMRLRTPQPPTPTEQAQRQLPPALWTQPFNQEDVQYMQYLGGLATSSIILEVKKLHDLAYKLGVEEAKEMTRGKFLNIFKSRRQR